MFYLVSRRQKPPPVADGEFESNTLEVIAVSVADHGRIAIANGWTPHDAGGITTASRLLSGEHTRIFFKPNRQPNHSRYEHEPSASWFERQCDSLDCSWFLAYVHRLAAGETVAARELQAAYRLHTQGEEIPTGNWQQLWQAWEKIGAKKPAAS